MSEFFSNLVKELSLKFSPNNLAELIVSKSTQLIVGLIVFVIFYLIWRIVNFVLARYLTQRVDTTTQAFVVNVIKYVILIMGTLSALDAIGFKTSTVLTSLGVVGLTIGFAAKDAFSNLISGAMIYLDRPFVIGDLVEIDNFYGRVDRITLRSTRIVTNDGKMLAVPNSDVINKIVTSYTNFPHLRISINVTIGVNEDIDHARQTLLKLVSGNKDYLDTPPPRVVVKNLNDYNVEIELQVWIQNENVHIERRFELREKVFNALNQAGIEMPFETVRFEPTIPKAK